jgi:hypothetical protein
MSGSRRTCLSIPSSNSESMFAWCMHSWFLLLYVRCCSVDYLMCILVDTDIPYLAYHLWPGDCTVGNSDYCMRDVTRLPNCPTSTEPYREVPHPLPILVALTCTVCVACWLDMHVARLWRCLRSWSCFPLAPARALHHL